MKEIFKPKPPADPGEVFYTLTREDAGNTIVQTEIGPVNVSSFLGTVLKEDIGRRMYRIKVRNGEFIWQAENNDQRRARTEGGTEK